MCRYDIDYFYGVLNLIGVLIYVLGDVMIV